MSSPPAASTPTRGTGAPQSSLPSSPAPQASPLSKKLPPLKKTGNQKQDTENQVQRQALIKILDRLWAQPSLIVPVCVQLEVGMITDGADPAKDAFFDEDWHTLARIPKHWLAEWICANSFGTISKDLLNKVDIKHGDNIRNMFSFFTGTRPTHPLHRELLNKAVAARTFARRAQALGNRARGFKAQCMNADGSINWAVGGCFKLQFNEQGIANKVIHCSGAEYVPEQHQVITKQFSLQDPYYDGGAIAKLGSTEHKLATFFEQGVGPNAVVMTRKAQELQDLAKECASELMMQQAAASQGNIKDDKHILQDAHAHKIQQGIKRAKETAKQRVTKRARVISLS